MGTHEYEKRKTLIHLIRSGKSVTESAKEVGRSRSWGNKWWGRFRDSQDWEALRDRPRTPERQPTKLSGEVRQAIRRTRSILEAESRDKNCLGYIGACAIQARLREEQLTQLPSLSSIERELRAAGMVKPR